MKKPNYGEIYLPDKSLEEDQRAFVIGSLRSSVRIIRPEDQSEADKETEYQQQPEIDSDQHKGIYDWQEHEDEDESSFPPEAEQTPQPQQAHTSRQHPVSGNIIFLTADTSMLKKAE